MSTSLKRNRDGISKLWKVCKRCDPFYTGGKVQVSPDERTLLCIHDGNLMLVDATSASGVQSLSGNNNGDAEAVACFAHHPSKHEVVVATQSGLLKHFALGGEEEAVLGKGGRAADDTASAAATGGDVDMVTANCIRTIRAHQMPVLAMDYDPTGTLVATGSADRSVRVWDVARGYCTHSFKQHRDALQLVRFHPDPLRLQLFSAADDNSVCVFDLRDSRCVATFRDHVSLPTQVALSQDGYLLASAGRDKVVNFYELRELVHVKTVPIMEELEGLVILNAHHSRALLGAAAHDSEAKMAKRKSRNTSSSSSKEVSLSGHVMITAGSSGTLKLYHVTMQGKDVDSFSITPLLHVPLSSFALPSMGPNSAQAGAGMSGTDVSSASSTAAAVELRGVSSLHYLSRAGEILAVTKDYNFCTFELSAISEQLLRIAGGGGEGGRGQGQGDGAVAMTVVAADVRPSRLLVGSHGEILDMVAIPMSTLPSPSTPPPSSSSSSSSSSSAVTSNSSDVAAVATLRFRLALVTNSPQLRIVDERFSCTVLEGHRDIVLAVDVSPDGQWLVSSSKDHTCMVWSVAELRCVAVAEGHTDAVGCVGMSHSRASYASRKAFMVSGAGDKILKRWTLPVHSFASSSSSSSVVAAGTDAASNKKSRKGGHGGRDGGGGAAAAAEAVAKLTASHSVRAHDKDINTVAVAPNDVLVATGSQDKRVRLWSAADLAPVATLNGHKRGVWKVQFSPVEKLLASSSGDRTVKVWSVADFTLLRTLDGHTASVLSLRFVTRGAQLLSAAADGLVRLWTLRTGECEATFEQHEDRVWALEHLQSGGPSGDGEGGGEGGADDAEEDADMDNQSQQQQQQFFVSGGSESRLLLWRDSTAEEEAQRVQEAERTVLLEQQMQNDLRLKRYDKALLTALELGHSMKVLHILTTILEDDDGRSRSSSSSRKGSITAVDDSSLSASASSDDGGVSLFESEWTLRLDPYLASLSQERMEQLLTYLREWNTNARHCYVSQVVVGFLLRVWRLQRLRDLAGFREALPALAAYSERHFQRLDRLHQASYVLDHFVSLIGLPELQQHQRQGQDMDKDTATPPAWAGIVVVAGERQASYDEGTENMSDSELVIFDSVVAAGGTLSDSSSDSDCDDVSRGADAESYSSSDSGAAASASHARNSSSSNAAKRRKTQPQTKEPIPVTEAGNKSAPKPLKNGKKSRVSTPRHSSSTTPENQQHAIDRVRGKTVGKKRKSKG